MTAPKKTSAKKQRLNFSKLFDMFVGNQVTLIIKNIKTGSAKYKISNLMFSGYLLEECEDFFYIGERPDEVSAAVKKDEIAGIVLGDPTFAADQEEMPEGTEVQ